MTISRRLLLTTLAAAPLASLLPRSALAAYPDKPIRLIVPFAAGGNADLVARLIAEGMSPSLGQTIVVENRAGAGGSLGAGLVASAPPDGYTLLTGSNSPLTVVRSFRPSSADPLRTSSRWGSPISPACDRLPSSAGKTVPELVALSKRSRSPSRAPALKSPLVRFIAATGRPRMFPIAAAARWYLTCWRELSPAA
jgi:hypothetical protein